VDFTFLFSTTDDETMKKWVDFLKIKFHSNENIGWHCMLFELQFLNWIQIYWTKLKFNGIHSQLKRNEMQIGTKGIENLFMNLIIHGYGVEKTSIQRDTFAKSFIWSSTFYLELFQ
jgi:hypothetical protein